MTGNEHKGAESLGQRLRNSFLATDGGDSWGASAWIELTSAQQARWERAAIHFLPSLTYDETVTEALATKDAELSALRGEVAAMKDALSFYRDNWDWEAGDGEQPNAVDVGSPPTFYEPYPNAALARDGGQRAQAALTHQEKDAQDG